MAWVMTALGNDGTVTEFDNEFHGAKHGTHVFSYEGDRPYYVWVHDNTDEGITDEEAHVIADIASAQPIYWSDYRFCYWMGDFPYLDHWVEGLFPNNGLHPDSEFTYQWLQVNVYE